MLTVPLLLAALGAEGVLRLLSRNRAPKDDAELRRRLAESQKAEVNVVTTGNLKGLVVPSDLPGVIYELKPSRRWVFQGGFTQTNALGLRGPEIATEKPPRTLRVAALGDSVLFGWAVNQDRIYTTLLESRLADAVPGRAVQILNFGTPGYNSMQEAALLDGKAERFGPDVVLVQYVLNDWAAPFFVPDPDKGGIVEKSVLFKLLSERLGHNAERDYPEQGFDRAMDAIGRIGRTVHAHGQRGILCIYPQPTSADDIARIRSTAEASGMRYVDLYGPFESYYRAHGLKGIEDLYVKPSDPHPNTDGHALIADVLAPVLAEELRTAASAN